MNNPLLVAIWVATIPISGFLLWFAMGDFHRPYGIVTPLPEWTEANPLRPCFRLLFGTMMAVFVLVPAAVATVRLR